MLRIWLNYRYAVNCDMEADAGLCFALISRYFFNTKTGKCEMFTYGGCGGNNNNYKTLQECTQQCNPNSGLINSFFISLLRSVNVLYLV